MDGAVSSRALGWVTSAPKIIVGFFQTTGRLTGRSANTEFLPPHCEDRKWFQRGIKSFFIYICVNKLSFTIEIEFTLALILRATFARNWGLDFSTFLSRQHCDIRPMSVSQILLISPVEQMTSGMGYVMMTSAKESNLRQDTLPYRLPFLFGSIASTRSIFIFPACWRTSRSLASTWSERAWNILSFAPLKFCKSNGKRLITGRKFGPQHN